MRHLFNCRIRKDTDKRGHKVYWRGRISLTNLIALAIVAVGVYYAWTQGLLNPSSRPASSHTDIIVYTSNRCGTPCNRIIRLLEEQNVYFQVRNVEEDAGVAEELREKLDSIGFHQGIYRLPVVDIFGEVLPVPSIRDVKERIRS